MFDYGRANQRQKEAISTTEGPLLIIAGPGSGKTFTLVKRIAYLIEEKHVQPDQIMTVTFTEKAARELLTRISDEFLRHHIDFNVHEMYIGTFHSICLRIMKEYGDISDTGSRRLMDAFEQVYLVCRHMDQFEFLGGFKNNISQNMGIWKKSQEICRLVNQMQEELVDIDAMLSDSDEDIRFLGKLVRRYQKLLENHKTMDFSAIQTETLKLFQNHPEVLEAVQNRIRYIMVDEYQDTNYIQEQLIFTIGKRYRNICVVGDDDQGMYRFRGATIRNILEFPDKFETNECRKIELDVNYRSKSDIIHFYSNWMENVEGLNLFNWDKYRYPKHLKASEDNTSENIYVYKCGGSPEKEKVDILSMLRKLQAEGNITNLNQVAFLFRSVKNAEAKRLAEYLEEYDIPVYSPRSELFFNRQEVKQILGCLILCFSTYRNDLKSKNFNTPISDELWKYYISCMKEAAAVIKKSPAIMRYLNTVNRIIDNPDGRDLEMLDLFYQLVSFEPFVSYLNTNLRENINKTRPARNLSEISRMISQYNFLHDMHAITDENKIAMPEEFFNMYLRFHYLDGIGEYEDESEYAPDGCVSFMTIHQSKGLEFPVVIVGSLGAVPKRSRDPLMLSVETKYFHRRPFEPLGDIKFFDYWRLYYTAFSRAQNLLVLALNEENSRYFDQYLNQLPNVKNFTEPGINFCPVKPVHYKHIYSFTSHISVYDGCPTQYKFYKVYGFAQHKMFHTSVGSLVHATLEDMNDFAIADRLTEINEDRIREWFALNYQSMQEQTGYHLTDTQQKQALEQAIRYYHHQKSVLGQVWKAEEEINLVLPDYILQGVIDLVNGRSDTVEIVDYKTGPKPDVRDDPHRVDHYRKQLEIYAYLIEERFHKKVSRMHLYYTNAEKEDPIITFEYRDENIRHTIDEVERTVKAIEDRNFEGSVQNNYACTYCDMRYVCGKKPVMEAFDNE